MKRRREVRPIGHAKRALVAAAIAAGLTMAVPMAGGSATQGDVVIGFASPILAGQPDQSALLLGQRRAAATLGWKVKPLDAQLSVDRQVAHIDTFISQKVDAITTFAMDARA